MFYYLLSLAACQPISSHCAPSKVVTSVFSRSFWYLSFSSRPKPATMATTPM